MGSSKPPEIDENDFYIQISETKNRGVFNRKFINKGDVVLEYVGELVTKTAEMNRRIKCYDEEGLGSYVLDFQYNSKKMYVDATAESIHKGRLINHSMNGNIKPFLQTINNKPRIFFRATENIPPRSELLWDYGEMRRNVLNENPWLKRVRRNVPQCQQNNVPVEIEKSCQPEIKRTSKLLPYEAIVLLEKLPEISTPALIEDSEGTNTMGNILEKSALEINKSINSLVKSASQTDANLSNENCPSIINSIVIEKSRKRGIKMTSKLLPHEAIMLIEKLPEISTPALIENSEGTNTMRNIWDKSALKINKSINSPVKSASQTDVVLSNEKCLSIPDSIVIEKSRKPWVKMTSKLLPHAIVLIEKLPEISTPALIENSEGTNTLRNIWDKSALEINKSINSPVKSASRTDVDLSNEKCPSIPDSIVIEKSSELEIMMNSKPPMSSPALIDDSDRSNIIEMNVDESSLEINKNISLPVKSASQTDEHLSNEKCPSIPDSIVIEKSSELETMMNSKPPISSPALIDDSDRSNTTEMNLDESSLEINKNISRPVKSASQTDEHLSNEKCPCIPDSIEIQRSSEHEIVINSKPTISSPVLNDDSERTNTTEMNLDESSVEINKNISLPVKSASQTDEHLSIEKCPSIPDSIVIEKSSEVETMKNTKSPISSPALIDDSDRTNTMENILDKSALEINKSINSPVKSGSRTDVDLSNEKCPSIPDSIVIEKSSEHEIIMNSKSTISSPVLNDDSERTNTTEMNVDESSLEINKNINLPVKSASQTDEHLSNEKCPSIPDSIEIQKSSEHEIVMNSKPTISSPVLNDDSEWTNTMESNVDESSLEIDKNINLPVKSASQTDEHLSNEKCPSIPDSIVIEESSELEIMMNSKPPISSPALIDDTMEMNVDESSLEINKNISLPVKSASQSDEHLSNEKCPSIPDSIVIEKSSELKIMMNSKPPISSPALIDDSDRTNTMEMNVDESSLEINKNISLQVKSASQTDEHLSNEKYPRTSDTLVKKINPKTLKSFPGTGSRKRKAIGLEPFVSLEKLPKITNFNASTDLDLYHNNSQRPRISSDLKLSGKLKIKGEELLLNIKKKMANLDSKTIVHHSTPNKQELESDKLNLENIDLSAINLQTDIQLIDFIGNDSKIEGPVYEFDFPELNNLQGENFDNGSNSISQEVDLPVINLCESQQLLVDDISKEDSAACSSKLVTVSQSDSQEDISQTSDPTYEPSTNISSNVENVTNKTDTTIETSLSGAPVDIRNISVPASKINGTASSKKYFCRFCKVLTTKLPRHLELKHRDEDEVKTLINLPRNSKQRKDCLDKIRKLGSYEHNTNKDLNTGILITSRRRQEKYKNIANDYVHCASCLGAFSKKTIHIHFKSCDPKHKKGSKDVKVSGRRKEGFIHERASKTLRNDIFPQLNDDDVSKTIQYDLLIILFGNKICDRYTKEHQDELIRSQLRYLGRLKLALMKRNTEISELYLLLHPKNYDIFIESVRECAGYNEKTHLFRSPSVASTLGTLLKKISLVWIAECIKQGYADRKRETEDFMLLYENDFPNAINRKVVENQVTMKRNKKTILPLKQDINALYTHLKENCRKSLSALKESFDYESWKLLSECCLILLQLFNRKRAGEVERTLIIDFNNRETVDENVHPDLFVHLDAEKKDRAKLFARINIDGKKGRAVPALLDEDLISYIEGILKHRSEANVKKTNPYIFGIPTKNKNSKPYLRACALMRKFSEDCGASLPETLRGTSLRKHLATYAAMLGIQDNEMGDLANFMGHDKQIHKDVYRVPVGVRDVTCVSQYLIAAIEPQKTNLDSIPSSSKNSSSNQCFVNSNSGLESNRDSSISKHQDQTSYIHKDRSDSSYEIDESSSSEAEEKSSKTRKLLVSKIKRTAWTAEERKVVTDEFGNLEMLEKLPTLSECQKLISDNQSVLKNRSSCQLKSWIDNQRKRKSRMRKSL